MAEHSVPEDARLYALGENLRGLTDVAGVEQPDFFRISASVLNLGTERSATPIDTLAVEVANKLRGKNLLFRRGPELGTVNPKTGMWEPMSPHDFCTWLPLEAQILPISGFDKESGKAIRVSLGVDAARVILATRELRNSMPEVERINRVRQPVLRKALDERGSEKRKGFQKLELLPKGYDAESKTFTVGILEYAEDMDPQEALLWLRQVLKYFPWGDTQRSQAVQLAAMLSVFCRGIFIGKTPMFLWNANLPGSGKSRLAQIALEPIFGPETGGAGWSFTNADENKKQMDAIAQIFGSYLWFDDVLKGTIRSADLNRFITQKTWSCRVLGSKEWFNGLLYAVPMMTGNQVKLDDNLERRVLIADLFAKQTARDRVIPDDAIILNDQFFESPANMSKVIACLYALVKHWDEYDRPAQKGKPFESFEGWSVVVPGVVHNAGFGDCLAPYEQPDSGGEETREWKLLVKALIRTHCKIGKAAIVTMRDIIRAARCNGLFEDKLGSLDQVFAELKAKKNYEWKQILEEDTTGGTHSRTPTDEEMRHQAAAWSDRSIDSAWSKAFRHSAVAGQWFQGEDGKLYSFGDRSSSKGSKFELKPVEKPDSSQAGAAPMAT